MRTTDGIISCNGEQLYVRHTEHDPLRPTLVFLHDSLGCASLWRQFPQQLAEATGCNLLVYDRRGYGRSEPFAQGIRPLNYLELEAGKLNGLLRQLGIQKALLFGHSDGASIALIAAARHPERIIAVISEAAHIFVEEETLKGIRAALRAFRDTDLRARLKKYHGEKTDAVFHAWTETWLRADFRHWKITDLLPAISCPVLVVQGEADEYGTAAQVGGITDAVGGPAEVLLLPGIGHSPHREAAAATIARAAAFIRSVCR